MTHSLLIIDDDPQVSRLISRAYDRRGWTSVTAGTGHEGEEYFSEGSFDLVLLDLNLPDLNGLVVLQQLLQRDPDAAVVMLTGQADLATAVEAMQLGAENFVAKPFDFEHLDAVLGRALEKVLLRRRNRFFAERAADTHRLASLGTGPAMDVVAEQLGLLAATGATVLLQGETGTGKGWVAELVHALSPRARGPLVSINCAGLMASSLESELFGHEKGAFPGAREVKRGLVEIAQGGTLFLDEVGDLAPEVQPKLLGFLDDLRFRRLGGLVDLRADVRLVLATGRDLRQAVEAGSFREDLYYRLAAHTIVLPPLRERGREAIADLAHRILDELRRRSGRGTMTISPAALDRLVACRWPGNVRELRNVLEYGAIRAGDAPELLPGHLPREMIDPVEAHEALPAHRRLADHLADAERRHIGAVLEACGGNRARAARELGISRATLYEKMKRLAMGE